jgi:hypothetical protein
VNGISAKIQLFINLGFSPAQVIGWPSLPMSSVKVAFGFNPLELPLLLPQQDYWFSGNHIQP